MTSKAVSAFWEAVQDDPKLQSRMTDVASAADAEAAVRRIVEIASAEGHAFTAQEFKEEFDRRAGELSDEQLEKASGGAVCNDGSPGVYYSHRRMTSEQVAAPFIPGGEGGSWATR